MPQIGEVEYDEHAFEHQRELHARMAVCEPMSVEAEGLLTEAECVHELHKQFPGLNWDVEDPRRDPEPDLPDAGRPMPGRYHADGPETERLAAHRVAPRTGTQRAKVLDALREYRDGMTDYELWDVCKIGARPHVAGTRREELIADGWPIRDSGRRRVTDTGNDAIVWVLAE